MYERPKFSQWLRWRAARNKASDAAVYWRDAEAFARKGSLDELIAEWLSGRDNPHVLKYIEAARVRREGPLTFFQYVERRAARNRTDGRLCAFAALLESEQRRGFWPGSRKWQPIHNCLVYMKERRCVPYARELWEAYAREQGFLESEREIAHRKMKKRLERLREKGLDGAGQLVSNENTAAIKRPIGGYNVSQKQMAQARQAGI